jgi:hypothetical protein
MHFREWYTVGAAVEPRTHVFSDRSIGALHPSGNLYVGDTEGASIRVYSPRRRMIREFGARGRDAGNFLSISSIQFPPAGDSVFIHDAILNRVSVFTASGRYVRHFAPRFDARSLQMYRHGSGNFVFVGPVATVPGSLIHITDSRGEHLRSFADLVDSIVPAHIPPAVREQLTQASLAELPGGDLLVALRAPYVVGRYSISGNRRWLVRETLLPNPWGDYIIHSATEFRVLPYPSVTAVYYLGEELFQVLTADFVAFERTADIRHIRDGRRISRRHLPFSPYPSIVQPSVRIPVAAPLSYHPSPSRATS